MSDENTQPAPDCETPEEETEFQDSITPDTEGPTDSWETSEKEEEKANESESAPAPAPEDPDRIRTLSEVLGHRASRKLGDAQERTIGG